MTDHKKEAIGHLDVVAEVSAKVAGEYLSPSVAQAVNTSIDQGISLAQVHATLYLAEQQRIANLIAWDARDRGPVDFTDWPADVVASYIKDDQAVLRQIHEGLGLA